MIRLRKYKHSEKELWCSLGSIVASRTIRKVLGIAISSDDSYTWWIGKEKGEVVGFGAVSIGKAVATLHHSYVFESFRGNGVYKLLLKERIEFCKEQQNVEKITATATEDSKPILEQFGFYEISKRGKYFTMRLFINKGKK